MIRINEIKFDINENFTDENIKLKIAKLTKLKVDQILDYKIVRESIDARKGITFSYIIDISTHKEHLLLKNGYKQAPDVFQTIDIQFKGAINEWNKGMAKRPIIVGFGPAGIFAGLQLAMAGMNPLIFEMGEAVDTRAQTVDQFWETGVLNPYSNVQFGEGGAGAFSDGKLTTRIKDQRIEFILRTLVESGAPEEIIYKNKPHIGTDILCKVVKNIREEILSLGGDIYFNTEVTNFTFSDNKQCINGVITRDGNVFNSDVVILAIGHSARNLYEVLERHHVAMERKPFAMGVRIEHPQCIINASQYGKYHKHQRLGAAEYKLTFGASNGRSVYSFCMCPGGRVVGSASEEARLVVNGMSYHKRDLENANSALLVNITPDDYEGEDILAGIKYQRDLESRAFLMGGSTYAAPISKVGDFIDEHKDMSQAKAYYASLGVDYDHAFESFRPTYTPQTKEIDLKKLLPDFMHHALAEAITHFGNQIPGFDDPRAVVTAVESRSSSPVRIIRDPETYMSMSHFGLYPCGEGAGYAGGITSSAVDGMKAAEKALVYLINKKNP